MDQDAVQAEVDALDALIVTEAAQEEERMVEAECNDQMLLEQWRMHQEAYDAYVEQCCAESD
jgi:hypothetical protein